MEIALHYWSIYLHIFTTSLPNTSNMQRGWPHEDSWCMSNKKHPKSSGYHKSCPCILETSWAQGNLDHTFMEAIYTHSRGWCPYEHWFPMWSVISLNKKPLASKQEMKLSLILNVIDPKATFFGWGNLLSGVVEFHLLSLLENGTGNGWLFLQLCKLDFIFEMSALFGSNLNESTGWNMDRFSSHVRLPKVRPFPLERRQLWRETATRKLKTV